MIRLQKIGLLALLVVILIACSVRPNEVLSNREMRKILIEMHKADGAMSVSGVLHSTEKSDKYYKAILDKHGISQAVFDSSLVWYTANPKQFENLYERVTQSLEAELKAFEATMTPVLAESELLHPTWVPFMDSINAHYLRYAEKYDSIYARLLVDTAQIVLPIDSNFVYLIPFALQDSVQLLKDSIRLHIDTLRVTQTLDTLPKNTTTEEKNKLRRANRRENNTSSVNKRRSDQPLKDSNHL